VRAHDRGPPFEPGLTRSATHEENRMKRSAKGVRNCGWFVALAALCIGTAVTPSAAVAQGAGGPNGVDIKIQALNRSTEDTPFCGVGPGEIGDRLAVDAFMDQDGVVTGTAVFEGADGTVTEIELDRLFAFFGGMLVQNGASQDTVPIWMSDPAGSGVPTAALVNVELPRGCLNTVSTFTPGLDKVTMQIKFR
jgi:hypothetical protein